MGSLISRKGPRISGKLGTGGGPQFYVTPAVRQSIDQVRQSISPLHQSIDPLRQSIDPLRQSIDPEQNSF